MLRSACLASSLLLATQPAHADIVVGFITALSGNAASIGIPYAKGIAAAFTWRSEVAGQKIRFIQLDDGSDPSATTRNARKLIDEEKVDVLIGTATGPGTAALAGIADELHVPMIGVSPLPARPAGTDQWAVTVPQSAQLLVKVIVDRMKRDKAKNIGFIGFSDVWGDLVYAGAKAAEERGDIKVLTNERYSRTDTSVTGQILKVMATHPDAVLDGGSGTQGALPLLALAERGYKGPTYGTAALVNADFVRVGGKAAEGIQVTTGPVMVAEQLPDDHFAKKLALEFRAAYLKANGTPTTDGFSAYSFDAWLILLNASERALHTAQPGTPEFRKALRDAILSTHELAGVHSVYNFKSGDNYGVDERGLVVVRLVGGVWTYAP
jgi:branched-chain amino acid transport system substrate-binding protein